MKESQGSSEVRGSARSAYSLYVADARSVNRRLGGKTASRSDLIESHLFYVIQVAKEYRNLGIPFEDLLSEGNLGLLEAAERFDRTRGVKFISYATWWIRKRIWDMVAKQVSLIRIPKYRLERLRRTRAVERDLRGSLRRPPTTEEIARECGFSVAEVDTLNSHSQREVSLETVVNFDSGLRIEDVVAERNTSAPDSRMMMEGGETSLLRIMQMLPARQRDILSMHYGLGNTKPSTLAEIGRRLGVSRERVRQLERQGIARLRRLMQPEDSSATA